MKLYSQLSLLIALCTFIVAIHAMEPDEFFIREFIAYNEHGDIIGSRRLYPRTELYNLYASEIDKRIAAGARGEVLTVSPLSDNEDYKDPLLELCVKANFKDLVERLLDVMPVKDYQKDYNEALIASVSKSSSTQNLLTQEQVRDVSITRLLVSRGADVNYYDDRIKTYPLYEILDKVYNRSNITWLHEAILPSLIFLLKHNAKPRLKGLASLNKIMILRRNNGDADREIVRLITVSGGTLTEKFKKIFKAFPMYPYFQTITEQRDALIASVQRGEDISFTKVNGISRFYVKDSDGNSLLFHALKNKNIKVVARLLCLRPELLSQRNFKDESVLSDPTALQNFVSMICLLIMSLC